MRIRKPDFVLSIRRNALCLLDLTWNQFKCDRFQAFARYSWHKAGFCDHPGAFLTPYQYCFGFKKLAKCRDTACEYLGMMRCAYCEVSLCHDHVLSHRH